ncbi:MAG: hypothetical protein WCT36_00665 [Candidatus Gracilibacteria bacterium]
MEDSPRAADYLGPGGLKTIESADDLDCVGKFFLTKELHIEIQQPVGRSIGVHLDAWTMVVVEHISQNFIRVKVNGVTLSIGKQALPYPFEIALV